jgi:hypothetical protein
MIKATMQELSKDPTEFIQQSVHPVMETIGEAVKLVVPLVPFFFMAMFGLRSKTLAGRPHPRRRHRGKRCDRREDGRGNPGRPVLALRYDAKTPPRRVATRTSSGLPMMAGDRAPGAQR